MDRLTRQEVEYLVGQFALLAARAEWKPKSIDRIRAFGDLALQSLSQEAVRDEVLGEFSIHYDFDLERITLAMVEAVDDEYAHNEKLRIAYAHDAEYRRRTIAAIHQRLLKGWIDLLIKPLLTKYHRHFQSMQRIVERETLKREPNAAGWNEKGIADIGVLPGEVDATAEPAPAAPDVVCGIVGLAPPRPAPDVASMVKRLKARIAEEHRPSMIAGAMKALGDTDHEWWHKGNVAARKRMLPLLEEATAILARLGQGWIPSSVKEAQDMIARCNAYLHHEVLGDQRKTVSFPPIPGASDE